jgi:phage shock protein A
MVTIIAELCILVLILAVTGVFIVNHTKFGKRLWLRVKGTADEALIQDASTPEGAKAYYNAAIEAKSEAWQNAVSTLGQMEGKAKTYEQQLRDHKKDRMKYDMDLHRCIDSGDDDLAKIYISKMADIDDKIEILKTALSELNGNIAIQKENADALREEVEALKAEKDKTILTLETSQTVMALKVDSGVATTEEDKMLEKVRDGAQKAKEAAVGHKIAYENSGAVQQKRLDQRMRDADIEAKLQALKNAKK